MQLSTAIEKIQFHFQDLPLLLLSDSSHIFLCQKNLNRVPGIDITVLHIIS